MEKKKEPRIDVVYDWNKRADETKKKNGTVYVRVYFGRNNRKYITTDVHVLPSQWSDKYWVVRREDAAQLNQMIQEQVDTCKKKISDVLTMQNVVDKHVVFDMPTTGQMKVDRSDASFLNWMHDQIIHARIAEGTRRHHMCVLANLESFGKIRRFEDVTTTNLRAWKNYLQSRTVTKMVDGVETKVPVETITVYGYWKRLKHWIIVAQEERLLPLTAMLGVKFDRGESKEREFLTDEEIEKWTNVELTNVHLCQARDRFLVQIATGLAYIDLMKADFNHRMEIDGQLVITKRREKSRKQYFTVILPFAVPILERWGWQIPSISNQKYNKYLKEIASACGIDKTVTSHIARHTYATWCLSHGIPLEVVRDTLGHTSIKTTEIYAKLVNRKVIDAFKNIK